VCVVVLAAYVGAQDTTVAPSSSSNDTSFFPPFLHKLTDKLKEEFVSIVNNTEMTAAEIDQNIAEWGRKHGIEDKVLKFDAEWRQFQNETMEKLNDAVKQLPNAFQQVRSILSSDSLSGKAIKDQLSTYIDSLAPEVQSMLDHVMGPATKVAVGNATATNRNPQ
ncbi:hypothetical protein PENTCL1PPCAC_29939, partial [Pristionchus entomophagus]